MTQDQIQILKEFVLADEEEAISLLKQHGFLRSNDAIEALESFLVGSTDYEIKSVIREKRSLVVLWNKNT